MTRSITVLSIASSGMARTVAAEASRIGYDVLYAEMPDRNEPALATGPLVVVWDGSDRAAIDAWLGDARSHQRPWLAVFPESALGRRIAAVCLDFVLWPGRSGEFGTRLGRLADDTDGAVLSGSTTEAFARLNLVGRSPVFVDVLRKVERFARTQACVLIEGPTGSGKELLARAIHYLGPRRGQAFVPVNCGALQDSLVEDELFGHEPGAFTDARRAREGVIEHARGGTLFLDEVETLSPKAQVTLLRFLEDQEYRPIGGDRTKQADVRIVAATNVPLRTLVEQQRFREDLHYRLDVLTLEVPPLASRREDIEPIARRILTRLRMRYGGPERTIAPSALAWLTERPWKGNVRELENVLHRAYVMSESSILTFGESGATSAGPAFSLDFGRRRRQVIARFEREYLEWLLEHAHGNVTRAAQMIGKERRTLGRLLQRHGLSSSRPARKLGA